MITKATRSAKRSNPKRKSSSTMTIAELEAAAAIYDHEFADDQFHEMSPANKRRWARVKKKMGRPKIGKGVKVVSISLEQGLLTKADNLAKKLGISRANLVSRGLTRLVEEGVRSSPVKPQ